MRTTKFTTTAPRRLPTLTLLTLVALAGGSLGSSCSDYSSSDSSSGNNNGGTLSNDRYDDDNGGGGGANYPSVPKNARIGEDGTGTLRYEAPSDGRIWVRDMTDGGVVYSTKVYRGDNVGVDPNGGNVNINGKAVAKDVIDKKNRHRILFDREEYDSRYDRDRDRYNDRDRDRYDSSSDRYSDPYDRNRN